MNVTMLVDKKEVMGLFWLTNLYNQLQKGKFCTNFEANWSELRPLEQMYINIESIEETIHTCSGGQDRCLFCGFTIIVIQVAQLSFDSNII